ncbi:nicotinamide phosphoribosyl transferase [Tenacibaculum phage PTm1]|uniref:Nicotinamide phosphoribosyltransferase n=2 Tax=Shirahamavirus PTm1 TaxID=2846435 RepID=A0A5S9EQK2_9CAUD|nr:nicotinamide phosphoribosyl transferase [Tenacibaculum phage PTm1]BBI90522.1 nicotinamide phosphoribosyl transferase [Tenacibaculum phage PTm1]BBI90830.1 nicotinamide phosphoribosyl transferase [Tenacibaculum phage PTm5]
MQKLDKAFRLNSAYYSDGYKIGHKQMLAPNTDFLYGTWIPRSVKYAPKGVSKVVSAGHQFAWRWLHSEYQENFFNTPVEDAIKFVEDLNMYLNLPYNGEHFIELHKLGYLPIRVKALKEGVETNPNIPHQTFVNTKAGFAWLTLYLETIVSALSWRFSTSATIALQYKRNALKAFNETCKEALPVLPYHCHDFSARGLDPFTMMASGLGFATSFRGSDTLAVIPSARYFYDEPENEVVINSVNASEHSVSTTKIFTVGEKQMIIDWCKEFPTGILSIVADTFDLFKLITEYLTDPVVKQAILYRDGTVVIRPDSGDPVDIVCGKNTGRLAGMYGEAQRDFPDLKGVVELLGDIFGTTTNEQGYKVLNPKIGCIYGNTITVDRQTAIYERLKSKGYASCNIVFGVGSFTLGYQTRDSLGFACKGSWFECDGKGHSIYKDPATDDGTKKSLKGKVAVHYSYADGYVVQTECTDAEEQKGELQVIYEDGKFFNQTTLTEIRENIDNIL